MHKNHDKKKQEIFTNELRFSLEDLDLLIAYIAKKGKNVADEDIANLVRIKNRTHQKDLSADDEIIFWGSLQNVMKDIYPVTMASIKEYTVTSDFACKYST